MRNSGAIIFISACTLLAFGCDEVRDVNDPDDAIVEWPTPAQSDAERENPEDGEVDPDSPDAPAPESESCSPAPDAFAYSLCSCEGLSDVGTLRVRGGGGNEAFVGINGHSNLVGDVEIEGSAVFYGGLDVVATVDVTGNVATPKNADIVGEMYVGGNFDVGKDLLGVGVVDIGGRLRVEGREWVLGDLSASSRGAYAPPPRPCGCDTPFLDIEAEVQKARETNHNAAIDLPTAVSNLGSAYYSLPTGRYYLDAPQTLGEATLLIEGSVSLYIDGALDSIGSAQIELADDATLDLYVSGGLRTVGNLTIGDEAHADQVRIFIGGSDSIALGVGDQAFYGSLYAPEAYLETVGSTRIVGGAFVRGIRGAGDLEVVGLSASDFADDDCPPDLDDCIADPDLGGCGLPPDYVPEG